MLANERPRILFVDDEPAVLEGLALALRKRFEVLTATSGPMGLTILGKGPSVAVVVSDMRMPGMSGATFLGGARQIAPDSVRILLTGHAEVTSAIAAVNDGQVFRFLTKPCPPEKLISALEAATEHHRVLAAERILLEQTLRGSIRALTDVLALANPVVFGRATRIKQHVTELAAKLGMKELWPIEVAAMLAQLGAVTLPAETVDKLYYGEALGDAEQRMAARIPIVTEQLLANIPRLEVVRGIILALGKPHRGPEPSPDEGEVFLIERGARLLDLAIDFDLLESQGNSSSLAVDVMRSRADRYDRELFEAFASMKSGGAHHEVHHLPLSAIKVGMRFAEDVRMASGMLLAARGQEVTAGFVERAKNFRPGAVREPIRVTLGESPIKVPSAP